MDNTVTRIEHRPDGSYIVTVNGKVYECEDTQAINDSWKGPPSDWGKLGKSDLCPICVETYERIRSEIIKEKEKC